VIRRCWDCPHYEPTENYTNVDKLVVRNINGLTKEKYYRFPPVAIPQFNSSERSKRKQA